jgi:5-formyltetrahydrofolate cyclo-ligase
MKTELQIAKQKVRAALRDQRESWDEDELAIWDQNINDTLGKLIAERNVKTLHTFLPMGKEVYVWPTIESALKLGLNVITTKTLPKGKLQHFELLDSSNLESGLFGTKHPANASEYNALKVAVCYPFQVLDQVPQEAHDLQMDSVIFE